MQMTFLKFCEDVLLHLGEITILSLKKDFMEQQQHGFSDSIGGRLRNHSTNQKMS